MAATRGVAYVRRNVPTTYNADWLAQELMYVQQAVPPIVIRTSTVNTTQLPNDAYTLMNATGGARSYTLLAPSAWPLFRVCIKKTDATANAVTIVGTVDGAVNPTLVSQYDWITLESDGTAIYVVSRGQAIFTGSVPWAKITGTPTTLAGYGITNAATGVAGVAVLAAALSPGATINGVTFDGTGPITIPTGTPLQFVQTATTTVASVGVLTTMFSTGTGSLTIATGAFTAGRTIRIRLFGTLQGGVGAVGNANSFSVKLGATTVGTFSTGLWAATSAVVDFMLDLVVTCRSVSAPNSAILCSGGITVSDALASTVASGFISGGSTTNVTTASTQVLDVLCKPAANSANDGFTVQSAIVETLTT